MNNWKENNKTKLTLQMGDEIASWETIAPCNDVPIDEIINAFMGLLVTHTYLPETVIEALKEFAEDRLPESNEEYLDDNTDENI